MRRVFVLLLLALAGLLLTAQTTPTPSPTPTPSGAPTATGSPVPGATPTPTPNPATVFINAKPYSDDEFPVWARKLRRFEIIAVGAFPVAYLFSGLGYDYVYYLSNGFPQQNAPWPAGPGTSQWTNTDQHDQLQKKNYTLIATAAGISLVLATVDWLLGK